MLKFAVFGRFLRMTFIVIGFCFALFNLPAYAECDGEGVALTTDVADTRSFDEISDIIAGSSTSRNVKDIEYLPIYLQDQDWYVQFEDGVVHGYAGCASRSVKKASAPYAYSTFTNGAYSGCLCSLTPDGDTWYPVNMTTSNAVEDGSDWVSRNTYCRQYCAQTCAQNFAIDKNGLRTAMVNNYGSCPVDDSGGDITCPSNKMTYVDPNTGETSCINAPFILNIDTSLVDAYPTTFSFSISAAGVFYVDWGDGNVQKIDRTNNLNEETITHEYYGTYAGSVRFGGEADGYNTASDISTISFNTTNSNSKKITAMSGSLGAIFGTKDYPSIGIGQPRFQSTFSGASNIGGAIPDELFYGVHGEPVERMFYGTFNACGGLTSSIPATLFCQDIEHPDETNCIYGAPKNSLFDTTFDGCSSLSGSIPDKLFAGIHGEPASDMFLGTFRDCNSLTDSIPETLFCQDIEHPDETNCIFGAPKYGMFTETFLDCRELTGQIPEKLFAGIHGTPVNDMFISTFAGCSGLTGSIPETLFCQDIENPSIDNCIYGDPAGGMFSTTFANCSNLSGYIPSKLFVGISQESTANNQMSGIFSATGLDTECPENTEPFETGFEDWFGGKVSCVTTASPGPTWSCSDGLTPNTTIYYPNAPLDAVMYDGEEVVIDENTYYEYNGTTYTLLTGSGTSFNLASAADATNKDYDDPIYLRYMAELEYYMRGMDWVVEFNGATLHGYAVCNAGSSSWTSPYGGVKSTPLSGTYNGCSCSLDKKRWIIHGKISDDAQYSGWGAKNKHCRETCPALCAEAVATDSTFRQKLLNYSCEIPEWNGGNSGGGGSGGGGSGSGDTPVTCESNQILYENSCINAPFVVTTIPNTSYFKFTVTAQGTYYVDWGDGMIRRYTNNSPGTLVIDHDYSMPRAANIRIGTTNIQAYSETEGIAAISFTDFGEATNTASAVAGISGSLAQLFPTIGNGDSYATQPRFYRTFNQCYNLSGNLPENLFSDLGGEPVQHMFYATFMGCSNITGPIPENFFGGVFGQPASYMFDGTFSGCSGLGTENGVPTYSIPEHLFDNIRGTTVAHMFPGTFFGCSGLTGSIPKDLFKYISGEPKARIFAATFEGCSNLTGSIPKELFANISGSLVDKSFRTTFKGTSSLESWIPPELFENMDNDGHYGDGMSGIFTNSGINTQCPDNYYEYQTEFTQYWDGHVSCKHCDAGLVSERGNNFGPEYCHVQSYTCYSGEYLNISGETPVCDTCPIGYYCPQGTWTIDTAEDSKTLCPQDTTSPAGTMDEYGCFEPVFEIDIKAHTKPFVFRVAARGNLLIDWGDGSVEKIVMNSTAPQRIQHYYSDDDHDPHTIGINGTIYEYYTGDDYENDYVGAITFGQVKTINETNSYDRITAIRGSLGKIFKTIGAGDTLSTQPRFIHTFNNCDQITSSIPEYIFSDQYDSNAGVHGAPVPYMFFRTFGGCTGIAGTITANLFKNIAGAPAEGMFSNTFYNCQSIDSTIPPTLFAGISGPIQEAMYSSTFSGCKNLHGTIPAALFGNVYGAPADNMYSGTFDNCINLEGSIPSGLFGNISGPASDWMFSATFYNCPKLSGYIPTDLFGELSGDPGWMMFYHTFYGDNQIIGFKDYDTDETYRFIPPDFFGDINNVNYDTTNMSMLDMFKNTAIYTKCPPGYYFYDTGFTDDITPYVSCVPCDPGTTTSFYGAMTKNDCSPTSFVCTSNKWLRVGDDDKICLTEQKPSGTKSLAIQTSDGPYYIPLSTADINMNEDSTKKMRVFYNGQTYSAHDESVQP